MSNETKRDVFDAVVNSRWRFLAGNTKGEPTDDECMMAYDDALPDDLPVIPEAVGKYIKNLWKYHRDLVDVFGLVRDLGIARTEPNGILLWIAHNTDTFSRAWVLGVWRIEESGEIMKLEAEKNE